MAARSRPLGAGFLELLVVITIMGVVAAKSLTSMMTATETTTGLTHKIAAQARNNQLDLNRLLGDAESLRSGVGGEAAAIANAELDAAGVDTKTVVTIPTDDDLCTAVAEVQSHVRGGPLTDAEVEAVRSILTNPGTATAADCRRAAGQ